MPNTDAGRTTNAPVPQRLTRPLEEFLSTETLGGILLLAAAAAALLWTNLAGDSYHDLWSARFGVDLDFVSLDLALVAWVNDAFMAVFFFVVGLEIKREVLRGELGDRRKAALPIAAAVGGMIAPATIFYALNAGTDGDRGWGIPMATDIAFAVGVLALLGKRVPASLKVFLLTLAIADDLGAILVIALFYTGTIDLAWLGLAVALLALTYAMGQADIRYAIVYVALAVVTWVAVHESGVHATIAGVTFALVIPINWHTGQQQLQSATEQAGMGPPTLDRLEHALHSWTSYVIVPIFALANAGIALDGNAIADAASSRVTLGVVLGLVIGKPLGILVFSWLAARTGLATLPRGVTWPHLFGAGLIAGIGFTVSIFITDLAYTDAARIEHAKLGILAASAGMAVLGLLTLYLISKRRDELTTSVAAAEL